MKMEEHARAWAHEFVAGVLSTTNLPPERRNSLHWEILSHLHEAAERRVEARSGDHVTLADLQAVVAEMGGREGIAQMFLQTRVAATPRAGFGKRLGAFLIDGVLALMVFATIGFVEAVLFPFDFFYWMEDGLFLVALGVIYVGFVFTEFRFGATPGKMAFKLRTVKTDGRPITVEAAMIRSVAKVVPPLLVIDVLLYLLVFQKDDQRASDRIADTIVIDTTRTVWAPETVPAAPPSPVATTAPSEPPTRFRSYP